MLSFLQHISPTITAAITRRMVRTAHTPAIISVSPANIHREVTLLQLHTVIYYDVFIILSHARSRALGMEMIVRTPLVQAEISQQRPSNMARVFMVLRGWIVITLVKTAIYAVLWFMTKYLHTKLRWYGLHLLNMDRLLEPIISIFPIIPEMAQKMSKK